MSKLRLFHQEILEEEGMKVSDLPIELQRRIKGFDLLKSKYEKNPNDEKQFILLQKNAVKLGDAIQNFIENDYDDEDEDEDEDEDDDKDDTPKGKSEKSEKSEKSQRSEKSESSNDKAPKKTSGAGFGNLMMEKKILAIMESKGQNRIKISDLESIIGREPDYPEQKVNNITLRKVFLSSDYRLA
jgi:hypothetical protein